MGSAVLMRADYSAAELRRLARRSKDTRQSSRLLSLAAVRDGMSRAEAARIGGMDSQTLRDWVHRFNDAGPDGIRDSWSSGPRARLSPEQLAELSDRRAAQVKGARPLLDHAFSGLFERRRDSRDRASVDLTSAAPERSDGSRHCGHRSPQSPG